MFSIAYKYYTSVLFVYETKVLKMRLSFRVYLIKFLFKKVNINFIITEQPSKSYKKAIFISLYKFVYWNKTVISDKINKVLQII